MLFFEDIEPGLVLRSEPTTLSRDAIIAFAKIYDPQPFHLDEAAGAASLLGGLAASGWQTSALGMRLLCDCLVMRIACLGSPGVDEVRWLRPVRPGDALTLDVEVTDKRPSSSRPDRGFVSLALTLRNATGEAVMSQRGPMIVQRRGAALPPTPPAPSAPPSAAVAAAPPVEASLTAFFPDLAVGMTTTLGTQVVTAEAIKAFARLYDPQVFHVDETAAAQSSFGGLIASGWQTAAFWMKHYIAARQRSGEARAAQGHPVAIGGPSPGFTDLRWRRPVRPGDAITYSLEVTGLRPAGRSNWGMVLTDNSGRAADGTLVFSFAGRLLWPLTP